jgi:hypothetical protein
LDPRQHSAKKYPPFIADSKQFVLKRATGCVMWLNNRRIGSSVMARASTVTVPLRHPAFQRLWLGLSISYLGDQFTIIALLWFVLQLTGSGAAVGLVILCFDPPASSLGRFSGVCWIAASHGR